MTRLKKYVSLLVLFFVANGIVYSQNLYDFDHSKKYADFLYQSQQFKLAAMEFERLIFMEPENTVFRERLLLSYRKSGQLSQGIEHYSKWYTHSLPTPELFREFTKLNLLDGRYRETAIFLGNTSVLHTNENQYYQLTATLLQKEWLEADTLIGRYQENTWPGFSELCILADKQNNINYRKPGVALALSAIVPGLGKVYSYDWKDGVISFLFVATNAFQAYRGFSKNGVNSVYGWIFGGLSAGFYAGNLYGSWKSASDYNSRAEDNIYHEIQNSVFSRF